MLCLLLTGGIKVKKKNTITSLINFIKNGILLALWHPLQECVWQSTIPSYQFTRPARVPCSSPISYRWTWPCTPGSLHTVVSDPLSFSSAVPKSWLHWPSSLGTQINSWGFTVSASMVPGLGSGELSGSFPLLTFLGPPLLQWECSLFSVLGTVPCGCSCSSLLRNRSVKCQFPLFLVLGKLFMK